MTYVAPVGSTSLLVSATHASSGGPNSFEGVLGYLLIDATGLKLLPIGCKHHAMGR